MILNEYADQIEAAMIDAKAAFAEKGLILDKVPCLTDIAILIRCIASEEPPEIYGVGTERTLEEHVKIIEKSLKEIAKVLEEYEVPAENLKVTEIPDKIRQIVITALAKSAFSFFGGLEFKGLHPTYIVFTDQKSPEGVEIVDWSKRNDKSVVKWMDVETDTKYISSRKEGRKIIMPEDCSGLFNLNEIENWFTKGIDLTNVDTSRVTSMEEMFWGCTLVHTLDLRNFDTSHVENMQGMFCKCTNLQTIQFGEFDTSNVTDMSNLFFDCASITDLDVSFFKTSKVTDMGGMFANMHSIRNINVKGFDTSHVTSMHGMFMSNDYLESLDLSGFDVSNVEYFTEMFYNTNIANINMSGWNTSKAKAMNVMFDLYSGNDTLDLSGFRTDSLENAVEMFRASSLKTIDISNFNITKLKYTNGMFEKCPYLTTIYATEWNSPKRDDLIADGHAMFLESTKLPGYDPDKYGFEKALWKEHGGYFTNPAQKG